METIKFIGLLCLTWLFTEGSAPIQFLKKIIKVNKEAETHKIPLWKQVTQALVNCSLCSGFWIGLVYYWATGHPNFILMACITSVGAELFARIINHIFSNYLNKL